MLRAGQRVPARASTSEMQNPGASGALIGCQPGLLRRVQGGLQQCRSGDRRGARLLPGWRHRGLVGNADIIVAAGDVVQPAGVQPGGARRGTPGAPGAPAPDARMVAHRRADRRVAAGGVGSVSRVVPAELRDAARSVRRDLHQRAGPVIRRAKVAERDRPVVVNHSYRFDGVHLRAEPDRGRRQPATPSSRESDADYSSLALRRCLNRASVLCEIGVLDAYTLNREFRGGVVVVAPPGGGHGAGS